MLTKLKKAFSSTPQRKKDLDAEDMIRALSKLARKIGELNPARIDNADPIRIAAAGGAISVLILKNRRATRDIDYFSFDAGVLAEISAATDALREEGALSMLPPAWINAEMLAFVSNHAGCETLFDDTVKQDEVLFRAPALIVYITDWRYQLVGKITRAYQTMQLICMQDRTVTDGLDHAVNERERNLMDAVYILRLLLDKRKRVPLLLSEMRTWYSYGVALDVAEIEYVNNAYQMIIDDGDDDFQPIIDDTYMHD